MHFSNDLCDNDDSVGTAVTLGIGIIILLTQLLICQTYVVLNKDTYGRNGDHEKFP